MIFKIASPQKNWRFSGIPCFRDLISNVIALIGEKLKTRLFWPQLNEEIKELIRRQHLVTNEDVAVHF
jgi:hypothetical protein